MIQAIAFLGNIGKEYSRTRHNAAWLFADTIPAIAGAKWQHKFKGQFATVDAAALLDSRKEEGTAPVSNPAADKVHILKPETYMNLSGQSVGEMASFYRIKAEEILVVHDEIELPLGTISLKWSGGLGGHNGLRSIKETLGTADFWRLRFGVGKPEHGDVALYVLSPFTEDERITLSLVFDAGKRCLAQVLAAKDAKHLIPKWGKVKCVQ